MFEISEITTSKSGEYQLAWTAAFRDTKTKVIYPRKCFPFTLEEAEALKLQVGDKIADPRA